MTPAKICDLLVSKEYSSALSAVLGLNLPVRKILKKIPINCVKQTVQELDTNKLSLLLSKLSEDAIDYRECIWVETILQAAAEVKIPENMRVSIESMWQQMSLLRRVEAKLLMAEVMQP